MSPMIHDLPALRSRSVHMTDRGMYAPFTNPFRGRRERRWGTMVQCTIHEKSSSPTPGDRTAAEPKKDTWYTFRLYS